MNLDFDNLPGMKSPRNNSLGTRVKARRSEMKLSQAKLGKEIGMTQTAIAEIEGGKVKRPGKLMEIAAALKTTEKWLLHGPMDIRSEDVADDMDGPEARMLKVMGYVGAGTDAHFYSVSHEFLDEIEARPTDPPNAGALRILGDSLGPMFDRWYVVYDDVRQPVTEDLIGKPCVLWLADGRVLVKKLERGPNGFRLVSNSDAHPPITGVEIVSAAKVLDLRSG